MGEKTNQHVLKSLKRLRRQLGKKVRIERMLLFGSRARGEHLLTSDVDIVLVSPDFKEQKFQDRVAMVLEYWDEDVDLEVLCYTPEEFSHKKKQLGIVQQAVKEGVKIPKTCA